MAFPIAGELVTAELDHNLNYTNITVEYPILQESQPLIKSDYVNYPLIEHLTDDIKHQIEFQKQSLNQVFHGVPTTTTGQDQSSFSFQDSNGGVILPELLQYFGRLKVVYASAIVAANSATKLLEGNNNRLGHQQDQQQPSKCLLVFAEVGAITTINELGKVKLVTVRTKPNQLLCPGRHQDLKLSLPHTEQVFDAKSPEGLKLLGEQPARIFLQGYHESVSMVSVQLQQDSARQFTARTLPCNEDSVDLASCHLVTHHYDTVICNKVVPSWRDERENLAPINDDGALQVNSTAEVEVSTSQAPGRAARSKRAPASKQTTRVKKVNSTRGGGGGGGRRPGRPRKVEVPN